MESKEHFQKIGVHSSAKYYLNQDTRNLKLAELKTKGREVGSLLHDRYN